LKAADEAAFLSEPKTQNGIRGDSTVKLACIACLMLFSLPLAEAQTPPDAKSSPVPAPPVGPVASTPDAQTLQTELARDRKTLQDWPQLDRYREANSQLAAPAPGEARVVFMGDSITDAWGRSHGKFFPGKPYLNRGISGQTTPQMLVRFRQDVIALQPKLVVILAGTNDIAGNTGPETLPEIEGYLTSMTQLAQANGIRVVLSSVMPVCDYIKPQTQRRPPAKITELNTWIKDFSGRNGFSYLDYYTPMLDDRGMLKQDLTYDGLHPNDAGYSVMEPLAAKAIETALTAAK
jgi:lysophospholipase L1-like esterase